MSKTSSYRPRTKPTAKVVLQIKNHIRHSRRDTRSREVQMREGPLEEATADQEASKKLAPGEYNLDLARRRGISMPGRSILEG